MDAVVVEDLVRDADVVIDNYRPGVLAKFGLGHDALHAVNPAIVTCSLTGFGETGPDAARAGYDYTIQALAGVMSLAGEPHGPPTKAGISYVDHSGGITAALGVCAALVERSRTGVGSHVDLGLFDVQISMLTYLASWQRNRAAEFDRTANSAHPTLVPAQNFRTADGHLALFIGNDAMWRRFVGRDRRCRVGGRTLRHPRGPARAPCRSAGPRATRAPRRRESGVEARLGDVGVACGAVNRVADALSEPQTEARGLLLQNEHPAYGRYEHLRGPLPTRGRESLRPAPILGEHTEEALAAIGYTKARIAELRRGGDRLLTQPALAGGAAALLCFLHHPPMGFGDPRPGERLDRRRRELGPSGRKRRALRRLDADQCITRRACDLLGQLTPAAREPVARDDFVEEALLERGVGAEHAAGRHRSASRASAAHQRGESLDAPPRGHDPERDLVEPASHIIRGDADVAGHGHLGAAAVRVAVECRDHRYRQGRQPIQDRSHGRRHLRGLVVGADRRELLEVAAGDEHAGTGSGHDQDARRRILDLVERARQLPHGRPGDRVARLGAVDREHGDGTVVVEPNVAAAGHRAKNIRSSDPSSASLNAGNDADGSATRSNIRYLHGVR